jgi:O-acetyl-ADP-ribose deacetylase (regulator of RNase III)
MIILARDRLEAVQADAYGYGAKDTGEMGGGAASSIVAGCGEGVLEAVRIELAKTSRLVGTAVITDGFNLRKRGVKYILHIVSIIKDTPQGAYCPTPELLPLGVETALKLAYSKGCRSVALAALATGEGRVPPSDAARYMLTGVSQFQATYKADLDITFCLPTASDHEAFQTMLNDKAAWSRG